MSKTLITGVTGFVGSYLARRLLEEDCEVYGLFRRKADGGMLKRLVEGESISINGESNSHGG
jgi:GDPmannose 4,6-dehydratase